MLRFVAPSGRVAVEVSGVDPFDADELSNDAAWLRTLPETINRRLLELHAGKRDRVTVAADGTNGPHPYPLGGGDRAA